MTRAPDTPASPLRAVVVSTVTWAVVAAAVGVALGWLWMTLADPPTAFVMENDFETEAGVTVWFWLVGFFACVVAGLVIGLRGESAGVWSMVPLLVACAVMALVCVVAGHHWFAPAREADSMWAVEAHLVDDRSGAESWWTSLPWFLGGLVGYVSAVWTWDKERPTHA